jgi:hypothetical protein
VSLSALRVALRPQRSLVRNLLLAFACVAAVLAGLLAMHSLNLTAHHNEVALTAHAVVAGHQHEAPAVGASSVTTFGDPCSGGCDTEHSVMGACVLALTMAALTLFGAAIVSRWSAVGLALARLASTATSIAVPAPPSLHVLSISRT